MLNKFTVTPIGSVNLSGVIGDPVSADLVTVSIKLGGCSSQCVGNVIVCAVSDKVHHDLIVTSDVAERLSEHQVCANKCVHAVCDDVNSGPSGFTVGEGLVASVDLVDGDANPSDGSDSSNIVANMEADSEVINDENGRGDSTVCYASADTLRHEQLNDGSLKNCFALAKHGKGNFFTRDGLLYRHEQILGQPFSQLVLPKSRRDAVLKLGHDAFGGHVGARKYKRTHPIKFLLANHGQ